MQGGSGAGVGLVPAIGIPMRWQSREGRDEGTCACFHLLNYTCRQGHQWQVRGGIKGTPMEKREVRVSRTMSPVGQARWVGALYLGHEFLSVGRQNVSDGWLEMANPRGACLKN